MPYSCKLARLSFLHLAPPVDLVVPFTQSRAQPHSLSFHSPHSHWRAAFPEILRTGNRSPLGRLEKRSIRIPWAFTRLILPYRVEVSSVGSVCLLQQLAPVLNPVSCPRCPPVHLPTFLHTLAPPDLSRVDFRALHAPLPPYRTHLQPLIFSTRKGRWNVSCFPKQGQFYPKVKFRCFLLKSYPTPHAFYRCSNSCGHHNYLMRTGITIFVLHFTVDEPETQRD